MNVTTVKEIGILLILDKNTTHRENTYKINVDLLSKVNDTTFLTRGKHETTSDFFSRYDYWIPSL